MSSPPRYSSADSDDERDNLLDSPAKSPQAGPSYPPVHGVDNQDPSAHAITYSYNPRYPATGSKQMVLGVLGKTKEVRDVEFYADVVGHHHHHPVCLSIALQRGPRPDRVSFLHQSGRLGAAETVGTGSGRGVGVHGGNKAGETKGQAA